MSLPPNQTELPANWWSPRNGERIVAIVAHATVGRDSRKYLQRGGDLPDGFDRKVSIHTLISKDGSETIYLPDERGANHAGFSSFTLGDQVYSGGRVNRATLGFELENLQNGRDPYPEAQLLTMGWRIGQWRKRWGNLPVLRHGDIDPTNRSDPQNLTVDEIEAWVLKAAGTQSDPWVLWASKGHAIAEHEKGWDIAGAWLRNRWLGAATSGHLYSGNGDGKLVVFFDHGLIYRVPGLAPVVVKE